MVDPKHRKFTRIVKDSDCRGLKILLSTPLTLPLSKNSTTELGNRSARTPNDEHGVLPLSNSTQHKLRVLFVDDEAAIREVMRIELPRMGHEVTLCENGEAALRALENQ